MPTGAGISLATMKDNVLSMTGANVESFASVLDPTGDVNLTLICNKSWWEVSDRFDFREKQDVTDFDTVASQAAYLISTELAPKIYDALRNLAIQDPTTTQFSNLKELSIVDYMNLLNEDPNQEAQPTNFIRDGGYIYFWPTPDQIYTMRLHHLIVLADIPTNGPTVPQSWHEIIELGAVYRGYLFIRDYNSANTVRAQQIAMINSIATNQAKEDYYKPMLGVSVPTREFGRRY